MTNTVSVQAVRSASAASGNRIRPLGFLASIPYFGIPAAGMAAGIHLLWPYLMSQGFSRGVAYAVVTILVMTGLLVASLVAHVLEGGRLEWKSFTARMRLGAFGGRARLWLAGGLVALVGLSLGADAVLGTVYKALRFTPTDMASGITNPLLLALVLPFNILGEELWWRGIILPRQELAFGKWGWVVNGVLWACFHAFKWWAVPAMMVTCLVVPFLAQRLKQTWPGIILHFVVNGAGMVLLLVQRLAG